MEHREQTNPKTKPISVSEIPNLFTPGERGERRKEMSDKIENTEPKENPMTKENHSAEPGDSPDAKHNSKFESLPLQDEADMDRLLRSDLISYVNGIEKPEGIDELAFVTSLNSSSERYEHQGLVAANRGRIKVGLMYLPKRPRKMSKKQSRMDWEKETAPLLGLSARRFRYFVSAAFAVETDNEKPENSDKPLPVAILQNRIEDIPAAIKHFRKTGEPLLPEQKQTSPQSKRQEKDSPKQRELNKSFTKTKDQVRKHFNLVKDFKQPSEELTKLKTWLAEMTEKVEEEIVKHSQDKDSSKMTV